MTKALQDVYKRQPIDQPVRPVEYEEIHIAATVKTAPEGIDSGRAMKLILPFSAFKDQKAFNEGFMNVYICADDPDKAENDVKSVFETRGIEFAPQRLYNLSLIHISSETKL